jgi:hypothetical protein
MSGLAELRKNAPYLAMLFAIALAFLGVVVITFVVALGPGR